MGDECTIAQDKRPLKERAMPTAGSQGEELNKPSMDRADRHYISTRTRFHVAQGSESNCSAVPPACSVSPAPGSVASGAPSNAAAYLMWPRNDQVFGTANERAAAFDGLMKTGDAMYSSGTAPHGQQASTLLELITIRAFHSKSLRRCSLGTALGFRTRRGVITNIPAIIVFVARKVHAQWLHDLQILPMYVEGPSGVWCDIDVVEFTYYGVPAIAPKEQIFTELVDGLRGMDACIGSGTQVASQETYGTLGAIVQSQTGLRQLGFITNRHVAVDLDYPSQKMFHPLPPNLGPGVYLGAVERATSFVKDDLWYGIFAGSNPETYVRADGAFIPFTETFDLSKLTTTVRGVGSMGEVMKVDLQAEIGSIVGRQVVKVGRSSGVTKGVIMSYAVEYNDEKGVCFFTDFLIVGEDKQTFDLEGDSGSLILLTFENDEKPRPIGLIWGGTANRGRLKLRNEHGPENWTSGVDLGRLLEILQLDVITTNEGLQEAILWQKGTMAAAGMGSPRCMVGCPDSIHSFDMDHENDGHCGETAAKDLLNMSSIAHLPLSQDGRRPTLDLAEGDLSMWPSGPLNQKNTLPLLDSDHRDRMIGPQAPVNDIDTEALQNSWRRGNKARKV